MSDAVSPEFEQLEQLTAQTEAILEVVPPLDDEPTDEPALLSIDDFIDPRLNPLAAETKAAITYNQKSFSGHLVAGEIIPPNRESYLRGVRNVVMGFSKYEKFAEIPSSTLIHESHAFQMKKRKLGDDLVTTLSMVDGAQQEMFQLFLELTAANDPLAVTLAQLYRDATIPAKAFDDMFLDSMICFQKERFKQLVDSAVLGRQRITA